MRTEDTRESEDWRVESGDNEKVTMLRWKSAKNMERSASANCKFLHEQPASISISFGRALEWYSKLTWFGPSYLHQKHRISSRNAVFY